MIKKHGKVVITQDAILVIEFEFVGGDGRTAQADALEWALSRLKAAQHNHFEITTDFASSGPREGTPCRP